MEKPEKKSSRNRTDTANRINRNRTNRNTKHRKKSIARKKRQQQIVLRGLLCVLIILAVCITVHIVYLQRQRSQGQHARQSDTGRIPAPALDVRLLTVNEYSRPGIALGKVKGVVIHYTANPGTSAVANRNYFEGLKDSHLTKASSHFVIGLKGEIVQCIPCSEISYASNQRNGDTVSIECCIEDESGRFNQATYQSVLHLTAWLVEHYRLDVADIIRHYDITGKPCPKYFVDYPAEWERFLTDVQEYLERYGVYQST